MSGLDPKYIVAGAFAVFVAALYRPVGRIIKQKLDAYTSSIRQQLNEAKALREEAQTMLARAKQQQHDALIAADAVLADAKKEAAMLQAQSMQSLEKELAERRLQAEQRISLAEQLAVEEIRRAVATQALAGVEAMLAHQQPDETFQESATADALKHLPSLKKAG
jgi:F-type H+-transporting ATPase subunit b